ncbi:MAG: hypothetical protein RI900_671, partial [Actinomycetota bacterium]
MPLSRRDLLVTGAGTLLLAACGGSGEGGGTGNTATEPANGAEATLPAGFQLVQRFPSSPLFTPGL